MKKIYRILGKRGRVTIPYAFRKEAGFEVDDVLSFTIQEDNTVLIKREKICNDCGSGDGNDVQQGIVLLVFLNQLTPEQQQAAMFHLSAKWAERNGVIPLGRVG